KIADYAGRGDLDGWIRTIARREVLQLVEPARAPIEDSYAALDDDPEVELMKRRYGPRFKAAMSAALASLPDDTRVLLRRYYLEGLGVEQIAALDGVAISTVSRRLDKARRTLHDATRAALATELAVADAELDSILRLIDSRM